MSATNLIWRFQLGDPAGVETLRGDVTTGPVVDRAIRIEDAQLIPHVKIQLSEGVALWRPESEAQPA